MGNRFASVQNISTCTFPTDIQEVIFMYLVDDDSFEYACLAVRCRVVHGMLGRFFREKYVHIFPNLLRTWREKPKLMIESAGGGHLPLMKYFHTQGIAYTVRNDAPFRVAASEGHRHVLSFLLKRGADIHADDDYALFRACENGHLPVVRFLAEHGVDLNVLHGRRLYHHKHVAYMRVREYLHAHAVYPEDDCSICDFLRL